VEARLRGHDNLKGKGDLNHAGLPLQVPCRQAHDDSPVDLQPGKYHRGTSQVSANIPGARK
jgi:hypothetical protein